MATRNSLTLALTLLLIAFACTCGRAQCINDECGDLTVSYETISAEAVFCEGATIEFQNNTSDDADFFVIDWQDGVIDTFFDRSNVSHQYNFDPPEEGQCNDPVVFEVLFEAFRGCGGGMQSCHFGRLGFSVRPRPVSRILVPNEVCAGRELQFSSQSCNAGSFSWDFGDGSTSTEEDPLHTYAEPGTYIVELTVSGSSSCAGINDVIRTQVTIVNPPNSLFAVSDDDLIACSGTTITFTNQSNDDTNIEWDISPANGWDFTDTSMTVNSDVISIMFNDERDYTITLTGRNACDVVESEQVISIQQAPAVNDLTELTGCDEISVSPSALGYNVTGDFTEVCWEFPDGNAPNVCSEGFGPVTFTSSGLVRLIVTSLCGEIIREAMVNVQSSEPPTLTAGSDYCTSSSPDTLRASSPGGEWDGPGIIDRDLGVFDPEVAGPGSHEITYEITSGACENMNTIMVSVTQSATVTTTDAEFCLDSDAEALSAQPPGGTWSGAGITDPVAGTFEPGSAGVGPANTVYTFEDNEGCVIMVSPNVEVFTVPQITVMDTSLACLVDEAVELTDLTGVSSDVAGGTYRWTVNGTELSGTTFNPTTDLPGVGVYPVSFVYENGPCTVPGGLFLEIIDNPQLVLTPQDDVCISAGTLTLGTNLSGGQWSGEAIDPMTGEIDLAAAGGGTFTYTYRFQPGGSCDQSADQMITIEDPGGSIDAGDDDQACEGSALTLTLSGGSPAGGFWTGEGVTDSVAGTVDLTALAAGSTYDFTYNIESATTPGCNASDTRRLAYDPEPDANFTRDGSPCINQLFSQTAVQTGAGFTYEWTLGDGTESTQPELDHTYTSGGTFTQTLTVTSPEGCPADTSATVTVTLPPAPQFALDSILGCAPFVLTLNDQSSGDDFTSFWTVGADTFPGGGVQDVILDGFLEDTEVTIVLTAENFCGAQTQVQSVLVKPYPIVDFGFDTDDGCSLFTPEISNVTVGNPELFFWDMGNGVTGTDSLPPDVAYFTPDDSVSVFLVTLLAINECGRDTLTKPVTVHPPDVRAFIGLDTIAGCQPWTFAPRSFSTPGANIAWEVLAPDGTVFASGNDANPSFELTQVGVHRVILSADRCGMDKDTTFVNVLPAPGVSFTADPAVCLGDTLALTNTSSGIAGGFYDLGDGRTTDQLNTVVVYDSSANYQISFTGFSALNNCPATATRALVVNGLPQVAIAATDSAGCSPLVTAFSEVLNSNSGLSYSWDFDDGNNAVDDATPTHEYLLPGEYFPTLTATDENGCRADTFLSRIVVHPDPVAAFALADDALCARFDSLQIVNTSQGANAFVWTIAGTDYTGQPPTLALPMAGVQTVSLLATNSFGCTDAITEDVNVLPSPLAALTVTPGSVCLGETVSFSSNSSGTTDLNWSLGDDTGRTTAEFTHVYGEAGDYNVLLTASNDNGCPADTASARVVVNPLPTAAYTFTESVRCGTPAEVAFTNSSTGGISYRWDFGDGATATTRDAIHTYILFGEYRPELIVETAFGCTDTTDRELSVSGNPIADFLPPPARACSPFLLTLDATPTEAIRYEWYLDDAFLPHVGVRFDTLLSEPNTHDIRLIAIYDDLCRDTLDVDDLIQLEARPVAGFTHQIDGFPNRLGDVFFQSTSSGGDEYYWDLGDGTIQTDPAFLHEYRINPDITVTHAITQRYAQGLVCSDTIRENIAPEWITRFFVPNAISPESGPDEVRSWGAKGFGVQAYTLEVYSSYGQLIFSTQELGEDSQPTGRWDGRFPDQSDFVLQGAYTWRALVEYVDGNTENLVGTVTVIR